MSVNVYLVCERMREGTWHLARPMEENHSWPYISPEEDPGFNPHWPEYEPCHARLQPISEFHSSARELRLAVQQGRGFPPDLSDELRAYYDKYWGWSEGTGDWLSYQDFIERSGWSFPKVAALGDLASLRFVFWFY